MAKAKEGDTVEVHYTGTLDDGEVFDSSEGKDPMKFELGTQQVIPGFEDAITGMEEGDEKEVKIKSEDAYGERNPELVQKVPRDRFGDMEPEEGMVLAFQAEGVDRQIPGKVTEIGEEEVTVDLNPPLAGKDLNFKIELVSIE